MKKTILLIGLLLLTQVIVSQNYQTVEEVNDACATLGFAANEDVEIAVDKIMEIIGLQKNFKLQECPNINNAVAKNIKNSSGRMVRYILYDNDFFSRIDSKAQNDWAAISILAHEIGHHLNGHALNNDGSSHEYELEADYFSGLILAKMGANLKETQSAIQTLRYEKATSTHPAKIDRLNEIERGWTKGFNYNKRTNVSDITVEIEPIFQEILRKARNGNSSAQHSVGVIYELGRGVTKDDEQAVYWYRKAAEQDNLISQYNLGVMYEYGGEGVEGDREQSLYWYRKAAEQDFAAAQTYLGLIYENGEGVRKDVKQAINWYRKAGENGDYEALFYLGNMYFKGKNVPKDETQALYWFRKAAEQGNYSSKIKLEELGKTW